MTGCRTDSRHSLQNTNMGAVLPDPSPMTRDWCPESFCSARITAQQKTQQWYEDCCRRREIPPKGWMNWMQYIPQTTLRPEFRGQAGKKARNPFQHMQDFQATQARAGRQAREPSTKLTLKTQWKPSQCPSPALLRHLSACPTACPTRSPQSFPCLNKACQMLFARTSVASSAPDLRTKLGRGRPTSAHVLVLLPPSLFQGHHLAHQLRQCLTHRASRAWLQTNTVHRKQEAWGPGPTPG